MLFYLVTQGHSYTIDHYLRTYGAPLRPWTRWIPYEQLFRRRHISTGAYIFSDLERLAPGQLEKAVEVWDALAHRERAVRLFNHPTRVMRRYELLRELHERGINRFDVYRLTEARRPKRFPVFIRDENIHGRLHSDLIATPAELDAHLLRLTDQGLCRENLLIVEYVDTSRNGLYPKYSAYRIGDKIIPRHVFFSRRWAVRFRTNELSDPALEEEEWRYLRESPHEEDLMEIFRLAHIDYGRVDYGIADGRIQVWEINTNPALINRSAESELRTGVDGFFSQQLNPVLKSVSQAPGERRTVGLRFKKPLPTLPLRYWLSPKTKKRFRPLWKALPAPIKHFLRPDPPAGAR